MNGTFRPQQRACAVGGGIGADTGVLKAKHAYRRSAFAALPQLFLRCKPTAPSGTWRGQTGNIVLHCGNHPFSCGQNPGAPRQRRIPAVLFDLCKFPANHCIHELFCWL